MFFALSFSQMGLNPLIIFILLFFSIFFIISFGLTSKNMDVEGLLETLYGKDYPGKNITKKLFNNKDETE